MQRKAYAKINWTLQVLGKRADGYHELDTLMQSIDLFDTLTFTKSSQLSLSCNDPTLPIDERNIALLAAKKYLSFAKIDHTWQIDLQKNIPSQAGLGGGSSDAAAVLHFFQDTYQALSSKELDELALSLGADVPFCYAGGFARCRGIGEIITPLRSRKYHLLLVQPNRGISTGALFSFLAQHPQSRNEINMQQACVAFSSGQFSELLPFISNDLTTAAVSLVPEIAQLLQKLNDFGACAVNMSGAGSCCYGVFETESSAIAAEQSFALSYPFAQVCSTFCSNQEYPTTI